MKETMPTSRDSSFASTLGGKSADWRKRNDNATTQADNQKPAKRDDPMDNK